MNGIILKAISGFYYVSCESGVIECKARGSFRNTGVSPVVGDRVRISLTDPKKGVIEEIYGRKNIIERPLIANIDKLFIVSSYSTPSPDTLMIDRLTAIARFNGIEPVIVFNKCDMGSFEEYVKIYTNAGFPVYEISVLNGTGIDRLKDELENCVCAFAGNSGVGKSSIINVLSGTLSLETGEVSVKLGRGRHTTRFTELYANEYGGYFADTPGFSSVDAGQKSTEFKQSLPSLFPEFEDYTDKCRFTSCTHTCEKGCEVIKAVQSGKIEVTRHNSYVALVNELKDLREWNIKTQKTSR